MTAPSPTSPLPDRGGIAVAPSLQPIMQRIAGAPGDLGPERRVVRMSAVAVVVGLAGGLIAQALVRLIGLITNVAFYGRLAVDFASPAGNHLGWFVVAVPVAGGVVVGLLARYGSTGIRGHGIPEAMEQVLTNQSRVPARLTILKPLSAAISIGTGGPFGAEGPIIATGGALGSLVGQLLEITARERKTLLAAGAAAGMAATFGCPIAAVLLAVELLLFEYRPQSLIPVALASTAATAVRIAFVGASPIFAMTAIAPPGAAALAAYVLLGALVGGAAVGVTAAVYGVEDLFERLPVHWVWWPAIGAVAVGVIGYVAPRTMGVGYDNITDLLTGHLFGTALLVLFLLKFVSWGISLGSGTSGGTLAPLFIIGGGLGGSLGAWAVAAFPAWGIDPRLAALVGMAAMFAGASRAFLASVVFAFETTRQPSAILPLLAGGTAAYLVSYLLMRDTIMTRKIIRRGVRVVDEYGADFLDQRHVAECMRAPVVTLSWERPVREVRTWLESGAPGSTHQGFPVLGPDQAVLGVVTRRDLAHGVDTHRVGELLSRPPVLITTRQSLREAADRMVTASVGRLPVMSPDRRRLVGIITRSDLLQAHARRIDEARVAARAIPLAQLWMRRHR